MEYANNIIDLYEKYGARDYIGEKMTQNTHMIRAAMLAEKDSKNITFILGAFLHDIGHLLEFEYKEKCENMEKFGVKNHDILGAEFLEANNIGEEISQFARYHVLTKRYLVTKNPDYYNNLSDASKNTLIYQGGKLTQEECENFEKNKDIENHILLRKYDDQSKNVNFELNDLEYYKKMLIKYFELKK